MIAIIELGSKQYIVEEGSIVDVEYIDTDKNSLKINDILLVSDKKNTTIGQPHVKGASVTAEILEHYKDKKEVVFKFKRKTGYKKTQGHRQNLTRLRIKSIKDSSSTSEKSSASTKEAAPKKETTEKKTAAKKTSAKKKETSKKEEKE